MEKREIKEELKKIEKHDSNEDMYNGDKIRRIETQFKNMCHGFPHTNILMVETLRNEVVLTIKIDDEHITECSYRYEDLMKFKVEMKK